MKAFRASRSEQIERVQECQAGKLELVSGEREDELTRREKKVESPVPAAELLAWKNTSAPHPAHAPAPRTSGCVPAK